VHGKTSCRHENQGSKGRANRAFAAPFLGQATLPVVFYAKIFGLIQTLIFSEVNEINYLRTGAG
jgi:hypothetical protein